MTGIAENKKELNIKILAVAIVLPLLTGTLSSLLSGDMIKTYFFLQKPRFAPPGWVFPAVWTLLYVLMGLASYIVYTSDKDRQFKGNVLLIYLGQLVMNFIWPILFFRFSLYMGSFLWMILLWLGILVSTGCFFMLDRTAGLLMLPYAVWTGYALYLNGAVYILSLTPVAAPK